MLLKPIKKNVIIKAIQKEKISSGGIVLAEVDREEASKGIVVAIGPEVTEVKLDEVILPNWQKAKKSKFDDQEFWIVHEDDIVLVFDGEE
jgi:co-chaperonin GroES (HSP10)